MIGAKVMLLGGFEARVSRGAAVRLPTKKAQALLAYLGVRAGQGHSRDKLAALLWGGRNDDRARDGLRHALADLRRALAGVKPSPLRIDGQILALNPAAVDIDVVEFERLVAEGTPKALEQAAEIYRGDLLLGFAVDEPLFEEWLIPERERLREMAVQALARLLAHQTKTEMATERAIQTALRLLGLDPLHEVVHRTLMRLYVRQGRRGAALKQYQICVGALQRELGTAPEAETRQLYQELLRRPVEVVKPSGAREAKGVPALPIERPAPPTLLATETPLFGRDGELGRLRRLLDHAIAGHGQVATVVGEAGVGKTRLVSGLAVDALSLGCRVMIGHCHESDSILPFGPWVDACRSGGLSTDEEILSALHLSLRAELGRLLPEAGVAGTPAASDNALSLFEAVAQLIEHAGAHQPLLLVLEDLHWADEMSLRLFAFVSRRITAWTVLLVTTAREEELADAPMARTTLEGLACAPRATSLTLVPLSRADTALLVRALTRVGTDAAMLAKLEERIWAMSEGNPFVIAEALRALEESGPRGLRALPARVRDLVGRRLDRLSHGAQQLAAVAAMIGRRFDFALLGRAAGIEEREAADAVEELVRHRVLHAVGDEMDFVHDRVRDVAYERLLPPRRRLLHRAVAQALEASRAGASEDWIEQLAHHALQGELWESAVRYLRQAGVKAAARSALQDARRWFERALGALEALPETRATLEEAFEIRLALRPVLTQLGEFRSVLELLREAENLAERLDDKGRRGRVDAFLTNVHSRLGEPDEAVASGTRALEVAERLEDLRLRILATTYLAQAHYYRGEYARVIELAMANLAALPAEWTHEFFGSTQPPSIGDRFRLIVSLAHLGRFAEAAAHEAEAIRLAEATSHAYTIAIAHHGGATLRLIKGDWATARARIDRLVTALRAGNISGELPNALAFSARALAYLGDAHGALTRCREAEQLLDVRNGGGNGWIYYSLASAHLVLGKIAEARRLATFAIDSASGRTDFVPDTVHLLGDIAMHRAAVDAETAALHYRKALGLAEARGMRPLVAHCHFGLGKVFARTGKRAAAELLATAAALYRELDMPFWLETIGAWLT